MRKILFFFILMSLSLAGCKCEKTVVNCHDMAVTVTNKAQETLPLGHYAGLSTGNQDYIEYAAFYALKLWEISTDHWSRAQGWLSMAFVSLLRDYPSDGPRRKEIEAAAKDFYTAGDMDSVWSGKLPMFREQLEKYLKERNF